MSSVVIAKSKQAKAVKKHPPGPQGHPLLGTMREFQAGPLDHLKVLTDEFGGAVRFRFLPKFHGYVFTDPASNQHILQSNNRNYTKMPHPTMRLIRPVVGNGLFTSDGDEWLQRRRLAQPAFHRRQIAGFGETMVAACERMLARWEGDVPTELTREMMRLTLDIAGQTLFSVDLTGEAKAVGDAFEAISHQIAHLMTMPFADRLIDVPFWPQTRKMRKNVVILDEIVNNIIGERRETGEDAGDLLSMLMMAQDADTGEMMDDGQLRDEVMTLLLAGHETTASTLAWVFALLAQNWDVREKLEAEVDGVLGGRVPTMGDLPSLVYTRMVLDETLRLYPTAYALTRIAREADVVGGYDVPAGAVVTLSPYISHRNSDHWPEPDKFDPERFRPGAEHDRPKFAYLPFGAGPRQCIGNMFAITEAMLVMVMVVQKYRLDLPAGHKVEMEPLVTLRIKDSLPMIVTRRGA